MSRCPGKPSAATVRVEQGWKAATPYVRILSSQVQHHFPHEKDRAGKIRALTVGFQNSLPGTFYIKGSSNPEKLLLSYWYRNFPNQTCNTIAHCSISSTPPPPPKKKTKTKRILHQLTTYFWVQKLSPISILPLRHRFQCGCEKHLKKYSGISCGNSNRWQAVRMNTLIYRESAVRQSSCVTQLEWSKELLTELVQKRWGIQLMCRRFPVVMQLMGQFVRVPNIHFHLISFSILQSYYCCCNKKLCISCPFLLVVWLCVVLLYQIYGDGAYIKVERRRLRKLLFQNLRWRQQMQVPVRCYRSTTTWVIP